MMTDDVDALLREQLLVPPADFAVRVMVLAQMREQEPIQSTRLRLWQWMSLGAGASLGALRLCEFVFVAFITVGAQ
jgi:hypothetical protein